MRATGHGQRLPSTGDPRNPQKLLSGVAMNKAEPGSSWIRRARLLGRAGSPTLAIQDEDFLG